jgi:carbon storage regulator
VLVLSRKSKQSIVIGTTTIHILRISGDTVQIGVEAPKDVKVLRSELVERKGAA